MFIIILNIVQNYKLIMNIIINYENIIHYKYL